MAITKMVKLYPNLENFQFDNFVSNSIGRKITKICYDSLRYCDWLKILK